MQQIKSEQSNVELRIASVKLLAFYYMKLSKCLYLQLHVRNVNQCCKDNKLFILINLELELECLKSLHNTM